MTTTERRILDWAAEPNSCAIVWPTDDSDPLYVAGMALERRGLLTSIGRSPERWIITEAGQAAHSS